MTTQARISAGRLASRVGATTTVLIDSHQEAGRGRHRRIVAIGRSPADAPEIDGIVRVDDGAALAAGSFARVMITGADAHDLRARLAA